MAVRKVPLGKSTLVVAVNPLGAFGGRGSVKARDDKAFSIHASYESLSTSSDYRQLLDRTPRFSHPDIPSSKIADNALLVKLETDRADGVFGR